MSSDVSAFDRFWEHVILPSLQLCYSELDDQFKNRARVVLYNDNKYKTQLRELYINKREWLKREYLPNEQDPLLDFHKLSSIICRIMIGLKPFGFDSLIAQQICRDVSNSLDMTREEKVNWQINNAYINYKAAFLVAEGVVFVDLLFWAQQRINDIHEKYTEDQIKINTDNIVEKMDVYNKFIYQLNLEKHRLYHYEPSCSHDDFFTSSIIALMKNDCLKRDFDYLQFSISMFQWQEYTKKQHLYDIILSNKYDISLSQLV